MNSVKSELWLARVGVALIVDCVAAYAIWKLVAPDEGLGFVWSILGIWAFQTVSSIYRFAHGLAATLATQGIVQRGMSAQFMDAKLKRPIGLTDDPAQLLASIADDQSVDTEQRVSAAALAGTVSATASSQGIIAGWIYRTIVTKALMALPRP